MKKYDDMTVSVKAVVAEFMVRYFIYFINGKYAGCIPFSRQAKLGESPTRPDDFILNHSPSTSFFHLTRL
jgi:hypothetical protein